MVELLHETPSFPHLAHNSESTFQDRSTNVSSLNRPLCAMRWKHEIISSFTLKNHKMIMEKIAAREAANPWETNSFPKGKSPPALIVRSPFPLPYTHTAYGGMESANLQTKELLFLCVTTDLKPC